MVKMREYSTGEINKQNTRTPTHTVTFSKFLIMENIIKIIIN